jgi:polysaccharide biosynthesis/export protein
VHGLYNIQGRRTELKVQARIRGQRHFLPCVALVLFFGRASCIYAQDVPVVDTPQQTNERIRALGATSKLASGDYKIGTGDLLNISVFDVPELTRDVRVSQSGTISIPLVPTRLHVAGLTEIQAEQMIADVLKANGLVSHPEVGLTVKEHRSKPITVIGAVARPMVYEADRSVTLLEVLAAAGGIANDAGDTIIVTRGHSPSFVMVPNPGPVTSSMPGVSLDSNTSEEPPSSDKDREPIPNSSLPSAAPSATAPPQAATSATSPGNPPPPGNIITIYLNDLIGTGDTRNNIPLEAGDVVTVPHAGIIYVLGAVSRPGGFVLSHDRDHITSMKVLALAGGLTRIAKLDHAVIIRRDDQGRQTETEVNLKQVLNRRTEDIQMHASDVLYIPDNRFKEALLQTVQIAIAVATSAAIYRVSY